MKRTKTGNQGGARTEGSTESVVPSIQDYGIIGDCRSAALVSRWGSIDWLCWPRFDKPAIFTSLLDTVRGGFWKIFVPEAEVRRAYVPNTNVLQTEFTGASGKAVLTDLMPVSHELAYVPEILPDYEIIRALECTEGEVEAHIDFVPRANYGKDVVAIRRVGKLGMRFQVGCGVYWLRSSADLEIGGNDGNHEPGNGARGRIQLRTGEALRFSFSYSEEAPAALPPLDNLLTERIERSIRWWQQWSGRANYDGEYRDAVIRSALTLKLLTYVPSGAVLAAATTSLPEQIGGGLNWDYRYCWLRDASLTIRALLELGFDGEAEDFMNWMLTATRLSQPELHVLYGVFGDNAPRERALEHLAGHKNSRPVRIGNAAREQLQLDVYGEVVDAAAQYVQHGGEFDRSMCKALAGFGEFVAKHWDRPDEGIWEPRHKRADHTHSRLLCWAALDRLISLQEKGKIPGAPREQLRSAADAIRKQIEQRAWNPQLQSYVSVLDGDEVDASLLLLSWYGFEHPDSARMRSTYRAIVDKLGTSSGLLFRYAHANEGTFAICSFWEAEYLALGGGSLEQAKKLFEDLLGYANDLGLYGEEIDAVTGEALGNFPQAFTHVGLIGAALSIRQRESGEKQLAHRPQAATAREPGKRQA